MLKDTVTVNMTADGQVIGVEELKPYFGCKTLFAAVRPFSHKGAPS